MQEITQEQALRIIVRRRPKGLFYHKEKDKSFTGIDNETGDAWVENFETEDKCKQWLKGE